MFEFVYSPEKRKELLDILNNHHPSHNERVYFVSFLNKVCGLSSSDIKRIISTNSNWGDYTHNDTTKHVNSLCGDYSNSSCEDFFQREEVTDKDLPDYSVCYDNTVFKKWNLPFFRWAKKTSWEYELGKYNVYGKMSWNPINNPIFRTIEGKDHILYYIDLDGDIELCWDVAKQIYFLDNWDFFKFSGSKGFHLIKKEKNKTRYELKEQAFELYNTIQTNLISFTGKKELLRPCNIDPTAYNKHRFVRGYCLHLKSNRYSIPIDIDMSLNDILDISKDITLIQGLF